MLAGKRFTLQGIKPVVSGCTPICSVQLKGMLRRGAVSQCVQFKQTDQDLQVGCSDFTISSIAVSNQMQVGSIRSVL